MDIKSREQLAEAMETVAKCLTEQDDYEIWQLNCEDTDLTSNSDFADMMDQFLSIMAEAYNGRGLTCDGIRNCSWSWFDITENEDNV